MVKKINTNYDIINKNGHSLFYLFHTSKLENFKSLKREF